MTLLEKGMRAPDFSTSNQDGETISLGSLKGSKFILFFYPKDNTPTCIKEVCNLRDNYSDLKKAGYQVFGVSNDGEKSHRRFIKKFDLPFTLLTDVDKKIVNDYGVYGPKQLFGINYTGIYRTTFIIDEKGVIEKVIKEVKSVQHHRQLLE